MPLTDDEKVRIQFHLCWTAFNQVLNVSGIVVDHQVVSMLRRNMDEAPEGALPKIRECLCECEKIQGEMKSARKRFGVKEVDGARFDAREHMMLLDDEYNRWRKHLADCLGGHINLWSLLNEQLGVAGGLRENYA
jgi:hypothetical protein